MATYRIALEDLSYPKVPNMHWPALLARHHVPFVLDRGERNAILQCPWCGASDEKKHDLSISLRGKGYKCWRNRTHRGRSNARLIQALLHCSMERARELAGEQATLPLKRDSDFAADVATLLGKSPERLKPSYLKLPADSRPLQSRGLGKVFWNYMKGRGFTDAEIDWLVENYQLHYATSGSYRYRIIVPVHDERGALMTWTARSVTDDPLRYKTLATDDSVKPPAELLLGLDLLWRVPNPATLVIVEGPFDALRVSALGHERGIYATCLFGLQASPTQADLLMQLRSRFRKVRLLLDNDVVLRHFGLGQALAVKTAKLPVGIKDPGALSRELAYDVLNSL